MKCNMSLLLPLITMSTPTFTLQMNPKALSIDTQQILRDFYHDRLVLVTGGCGFIGSHLVDQLVELGARVTIIDNLSTGSLDNIAQVRDKVTFIKGSITDFETCMNTCRGQSIIFHLAAFISVPKSVSNPADCYQTNVTGTLNLLEAARIHNIERFIFTSSSAVYGTTQERCDEEATPCNPISPYGSSKLIGELLCKQYTLQYDLATVMLRNFNVYGPRQDPNGPYAAAVAKFSAAMQNNEPVSIFGDGLQTRDFISVFEVVHANLVLAMVAPDIAGQVLNVATGSNIAIRDLFDLLNQQHPDYNHAPTFQPARPGDVRHVYANCTRYKKVIESYLE